MPFYEIKFNVPFDGFLLAEDIEEAKDRAWELFKEQIELDEEAIRRKMVVKEKT